MKIRSFLAALLLAAGIVIVAGGCDRRSYRNVRSSTTRVVKKSPGKTVRKSTSKAGSKVKKRATPKKAGSKIKKR